MSILAILASWGIALLPGMLNGGVKECKKDYPTGTTFTQQQWHNMSRTERAYEVWYAILGESAAEENFKDHPVRMLLWDVPGAFRRSTVEIAGFLAERCVPSHNE